MSPKSPTQILDNILAATRPGVLPGASDTTLIASLAAVVKNQEERIEALEAQLTDPGEPGETVRPKRAEKDVVR